MWKKRRRVSSWNGSAAAAVVEFAFTPPFPVDGVLFE
jgi:hypothetical protein